MRVGIVALPLLQKPPDQVNHYGQDDADQHHGGDGDIYLAVFALDADIAG